MKTEIACSDWSPAWATGNYNGNYLYLWSSKNRNYRPSHLKYVCAGARKRSILSEVLDWFSFFFFFSFLSFFFFFNSLRVDLLAFCFAFKTNINWLQVDVRLLVWDNLQNLFSSINRLCLLFSKLPNHFPNSSLMELTVEQIRTYINTHRIYLIMTKIFSKLCPRKYLALFCIHDGVMKSSRLNQLLVFSSGSFTFEF